MKTNVGNEELILLNLHSRGQFGSKDYLLDTQWLDPLCHQGIYILDYICISL